MCLHPEVQAKAQAEVDSVLGLDWHRLPTFCDRSELPYVNAIVLELLRWNPAVPLGMKQHYLVWWDITLTLLKVLRISYHKTICTKDGISRRAQLSGRTSGTPTVAS